MKEQCRPSDFVALVGIDWADRKHDLCVIGQGSDKPVFSVIEASPRAISEWANSLKISYPGKQIAIACELKKGPLVYALECYDHIVLFPISPHTVAKYRKAFSVSGAKDDPRDAFVLAELLQRHMDRFQPIYPDDPEVRALSQLTEHRRGVVQNRVDLTNKITGLRVLTTA